MDKIEFFGNIPRNVFCALPLPCLRGLKSVMSATTAALHPFSVVTNLLLTGKRFSGGFFGDLHRQLLFTSPAVLHCPPFTCAGCHHQQDVKRGRDCYTLASFHLGSIITSFQRGLRRVKHPPQYRPPHCKPAPLSPLLTRTPPWSAASRARNVAPPFKP